MSLFQKKEEVEPQEKVEPQKKIIPAWSIGLTFEGGYSIVIYTEQRQRIETELENIRTKIRQSQAYTFLYSKSSDQIDANYFNLDIKEKDKQNRFIIPFPSKIITIDFKEYNLETVNE